MTLTPLLGDLSDASIPHWIPAPEATAAKRTEVVSSPWKFCRAPKPSRFYPAGTGQERGEAAEKSLSFPIGPFLSVLSRVSKRIENWKLEIEAVGERTTVTLI